MLVSYVLFKVSFPKNQMVMLVLLIAVYGPMLLCSIG